MAQTSRNESRIAAFVPVRQMRYPYLCVMAVSTRLMTKFSGEFAMLLGAIPKRHCLLPALVLTLVGNLAFANGVVTFDGGDGSEANPYQISTWAQLNAIRNDLSAHYLLTASLAPSDDGYSTYAGATANAGQGWLPIGSGPFFTGSFDGGGNIIAGLFINRPDLDYVGLFGYWIPPVSSDGETPAQIKNIGLSDVAIVGGKYTGALIGRLRFGQLGFSVERAYVVGGSVSGTIAVGGLIGTLEANEAREIFSAVDVAGHDEVGGLIGRKLGAVEDCFAVSSVSISDPDSIPADPKGIGGLFGWATRATRRCYAAGAVGPVGTETLAGGLFGTDGSDTEDSYWDVSSTGQTSARGGANDEMGGLDSSDMRQLDQIATNWDFDNVWTITDPATGLASYPYLRSMPLLPPPGNTAEPAAPTLTAPADDATDVDVVPTLTWSSALLANAYELELETADGLTTVYQGSVDDTSFTPEMLQGNTMYRWRVRGINSLLDADDPDLGPYSATFDFTTGPRPDEIFSDRFQATGP